jgi:hypothetical protein
VAHQDDALFGVVMHLGEVREIAARAVGCALSDGCYA